MSESVRTCVKCGVEKPLEKFRYRTFNSDGNPTERRNDCNECAYKETKIRNSLRKQWEHIKPTENDCCPICLRKEKEIWTRSGNQYYSNGMNKKTPWVLDHDHDTHEFRGWICDYCNVGLSRFFDDPDILNRAMLYLRKELEYSQFVESNKPNSLEKFMV
jgi:hypothetical protein